MSIIATKPSIPDTNINGIIAMIHMQYDTDITGSLAIILILYDTDIDGFIAMILMLCMVYQTST